MADINLMKLARSNKESKNKSNTELQKKPVVPIVALGRGKNQMIRDEQITVKEINVNDARPWLLHDRLQESLTKESLKNLIDSIREETQQELALVRPISDAQTGEPHYEIIYGVRRWSACKHILDKNLKPRKLRARVIEGLTDEQAAILMFCENEYREDLKPMERAFSCYRLDKAGMFRTDENGTKESVTRSRKRLSELFKISKGQISKELSVAKFILEGKAFEGLVTDFKDVPVNLIYQILGRFDDKKHPISDEDFDSEKTKLVEDKEFLATATPVEVLKQLYKNLDNLKPVEHKELNKVAIKTGDPKKRMSVNRDKKGVVTIKLHGFSNPNDFNIEKYASSIRSLL